MADLLVYGAGGLGREVAQLIMDLRDDGAALWPIGFLSDDPKSHGSIVGGLPVLGDHRYVEDRPGQLDVILGVGSPVVKRRLATKVAPFVRSFPRLVHPSVVVSRRVQWGEGSIVCSKSCITVDIQVGDFALINIACTIGHDCVIGKYATINPGTHVSGSVNIGSGASIGTGTSIIHGIRIGDWSIVGAGAAVTSDIQANCTAVGVPARVIKERPEGWHLQDGP